MEPARTTTITAPFEITGWDATPYDEPAEGPTLSRVTVRKRFSGPLEGTSVAERLIADGAGGRSYKASECAEGTLEGRRGTFVLQHGGVDDTVAEPHTFGHVVPGSGTGELTRLRGDVQFAHDATGARLLLTVPG